MNTAKKSLLLIIVCFVVLGSLPAALESDDLLLADVPIGYGQVQLKERIIQRTNMERPALALVLSGGSARAFAHIGVLQYLEEQDIIPDLIISNSMGSIVGLLYAAGLSPAQILEAVSDVSIQSLFDITLPLAGGLLDSSRFVAHIASILGADLQLQDLQIPIIVVTEDMVTKRQVHISSGDFYTVLKASYALPVYFPPVEFNGHLLLDGGITNLVPVDLAYMYADDVIVSTTFYDIDTLNLKDPLTILNVSIDIGKRRRGVQELKGAGEDVIWIRNAVEDVSFMEFARVDELFLKGYESARQQGSSLDRLGKNLQDFSLDEHRLHLSQALEDSYKKYQLFSHVRLSDPAFTLALGLDSEFHDKDTTYLQDDITIGLKARYGVADFLVTANAGVSLQLMSNDQFSAVPAVRLGMEYHFLKYFRARANTSFFYDFSAHTPILTLAADVEGRTFFFDNALRLSMMQSYEQLNNFKNSNHLAFFDDHTYILSTKAMLLLSLQQKEVWSLNDSSLSLKYQLLGDFSKRRSFAGFGFTTEVAYRPYNLFAGLQSFARFSLDGQGDVPFFLSDGFRTTNPTIKAQGHDLQAVVANPANHLVGMSFSLGYRPQQNPTVAELLIFSNTSLAMYSDILFYQDSFSPAFSLGVEISSEISLLGIQTLPLALSVGWDQSMKSVVWGVVINVLF